MVTKQRNTETELVTDQTRVEIFSAGCSVCQPQVDALVAGADATWDLIVHDLSQADEALIALAASYRIQRVPAVVIEGRLVSCCDKGGPELATMVREAQGGRA